MSPEELDALLNAPALEPPPGVTPMFDNPPNRNDYAWGITTVCMLVATLCLCLRWYVRIWLDRKVRIEDGKVQSLNAFLIHYIWTREADNHASRPRQLWRSVPMYCYPSLSSGLSEFQTC